MNRSTESTKKEIKTVQEDAAERKKDISELKKDVVEIKTGQEEINRKINLILSAVFKE